ncbi:MAG: RNA methyltransferase, TrmH family, group 3 [candidate division TM6 bacterium GW2011_GWE2_42_60]|nr:MAG: RNA methyltransferase, TrmH family, group 3 [candidate division TM6 bacterium GW2011_GWE2_42_60]HBY05857.1 hypothetical protein [Candidatus Dependentiae bacterium]
MKRKEQKEQTGVYIYGIHPIIELLTARRRQLTRLYTTDPVPKAFNQIRALLPNHVPISFVKREVLNTFADTTDHQGFVGITSPFQFRKKPFSPEKSPFLVLIDSVQDTRNLGGIIRSVHCTGAHGLVLAGRQSAPINNSTAKASAGLIEHLEIYLAPTAYIAAQELKNAGYNLYLGALNGKDATTVDFKPPFCIVIGSEGKGISPEVLRLGEKVTLGQKTADISYNASVAAGILLFLAATKNRFI